MAPAAEPAGRVGVPDRFEDLLSKLGRLNYVWTNTESVLIHLIAGLARTDLESATVIFLTLNTTRARLSLVERCAKLPRNDPALRDEVLDLTRRMGRALTLRNRFNHCIYAFDTEAGTARTIQMRVHDTAREVRFGKASVVDEELVARVSASLDELKAINLALWACAERHGFPR